MREIKFLFSCMKNTPVLLRVFIITLAAVIGVMPFIMNEQLGSEDYIFSKLFIFFPAYLLAVVGIINVCGTVGGNKLARSMPIAKALYTRGVPVFCIIMSAGISCVTMSAYFVFLGVKGAEAAHFSDTLICGAVMCGCLLIYTPLVADHIGGAVTSYMVLFPVAGFVFIIGDKGKAYGLGVPVLAAAAIFVGTVAVCAAWAFFISAVKFKRTNVKIAPVADIRE